jgi:NTP pyrophosphatase (non-canonical NTP hydrolase)
LFAIEFFIQCLEYQLELEIQKLQLRSEEMKELVIELRKFAEERDWAQFHSPKNLAMALSVEVAEIVEIFQWLTQEESRNLTPEKLEKVQQEIADVMIFLTNLADKLGIDPLAAAKEKIEKNRIKYPVERAKGTAKKYTQL